MNYFTRSLICERLRLNRRSSYRIISSSRLSLINGDELLALLNDARRGIHNPLSAIPSDLQTPEELSVFLDGVVSARKLITWTKRRKNIPPHFRLNVHTTRFPRALFIDWLDRNSRIRTAK